MTIDAIIFNEDFDHFLCAHPPESGVGPLWLSRYIDLYAATGVTHMFFCPNGMKANFKSRVLGALWEDVRETNLSPSARRYIDNARAFHEIGINPYAYWCNDARAKGISPWLTVRMNDVHGTDHDGGYTVSKFWRERPDLRRVDDTVHAWADVAFDYEKKAVQDYFYSFIQELLELTDPDGIELDWMRFVYHFRAGRERFGNAALRGFLWRVRELTRAVGARRGHDIGVSVRVPNLLGDARALGLDAIDWARCGLVDQIVVSQFFGTVYHDVPIEEWREALSHAAPTVKLAVCADMNLRAGPGLPSFHPRVPFYRGWAAAAAHRGADRVYLFNYQYLHDQVRAAISAQERAEYYAFLKELARPDQLADKPRQYVVSFNDVQPLGQPAAHLLPVDASLNRFYRFKLYTGPVPMHGHTRLILGLADKPDVNSSAWQGRINSHILRPGFDLPTGPLHPGCKRLIGFDVPNELLLSGHNMIEVVPKSDGVQTITWIELNTGNAAKLGE
jgi:hypothetical protein